VDDDVPPEQEFTVLRVIVARAYHSPRDQLTDGRSCRLGAATPAGQ
jgi:hypothetical protein